MFRKLLTIIINLFLIINVFTVAVKADEEEIPVTDTEESSEVFEEETPVSEEETGEEKTPEDREIIFENEDEASETDVELNEEASEEEELTEMEEILPAEDESDPASIEEELVPAEEEISQEGMNTIDLSDYILQSGGFRSFEAELAEEGIEISSVTTDADYSAAEKAILNALKKQNESVDLSSYGITQTQLSNAFFRVINENPDLFFVQSKISWSYSGSYVTKAYFYYYSYTQAQIDLFNETVDAIVKMVDPEWPALSKAIFMHDWIVTHCTYDYSFSNYNAYNVIVDGTAVCQGYALAYVLLCQMVDVQCQFISSRGLNHAWNLLRIDGEYFYTDCTWDDPSGGISERCSYDYFLLSRDGLYNKGHDATDWLLNNVSNAYSSIGTSDRFEDMFWKDIEKSLCLFDDYTLYYDGAIKVYDLRNKEDLASYTAPGHSYDYWYGLAAVTDSDGSLYFANNYEIYSLDPVTGAMEKIYALSQDERSFGVILVLTMKKHKVRYLVADSPYSSDENKTWGIVNAETYAYQNADNAIVLYSDDDALYNYLSESDPYISLVFDSRLESESAYEIRYRTNEKYRTQDYYYEFAGEGDDEYVSIPYDVLLNHNIPSGNVCVEVEYYGKTFRSVPFDLKACVSAPPVTVLETADALIFSSTDTDYLNELVRADVVDEVNEYARLGGRIDFSVDGREGSIYNLHLIGEDYDSSSKDMVYEDGKVIVSKEALFENGIMNGEEALCKLCVKGYTVNSVLIEGGLHIACEPGMIDFEVYQIDGDIIIESEDSDWLKALAVPETYLENDAPSFHDYGYITGIANDVEIAGQNYDLSIVFKNESHVDRDHIEYYYEDGKIIIPEKTLHDSKIPEATYDLIFHAPGHEDNEVSSVAIKSPIRTYVPWDVRFYNDQTYGIMVWSTDTDWLNAIIEGGVSIIDTKGKVYRMDSANRFAWIKDDTVIYISPSHLAAAGITSGRYTVLLEPEGYINYSVLYNLNIGSSVKKIFTVRFFDDEGGLIDAVSVKAGNTVKAPSSPSKKGYKFAGWQKDGVLFKTSSTVKENLDLYPMWNENSYKLVYNANGGKGTLEKAATHKLNDPVFVSSLSPYKNGYAFLGWSANKKDTEPVYLAGQDITGINIDLKDGATLTLYAIYSDPLDYNVELDPAGGVLKAKQSYDARLAYDGSTGHYQGTYTILSAAIKLPTLVKDHYKFNGWYEDKWNEKKQAYVPAKLTSIAKGSYGDKVVYASFTPVNYKLTYNLNKGKIAKGQIYDKTFNIETESLNLPIPERKGYLFKGWYADKTLTIEVNGISDLAYKNTNLYAKWEPITYSVVFRYGEKLTGPITLVYDKAVTVNRPLFESMEGYLPSKYSYVSDAEKTVKLTSMKFKNLTAVNGKTVTIDCDVFKFAKYKVTYVLNGGKASNKTSYDIDHPVTLDPATKKGYTFIGWYEDPEFKGEAVNELTIGDHTLYAGFTINEYTITYEYNGAGPVEGNPDTYMIVTPKIVLKAPVKEGYTFLGWYNKATNRKVSSIAKGSIGDLVLEARWKVK